MGSALPIRFMDSIKDYEEVLKEIERGVINFWRKNPDMTNYTAMRAYEAAIAYYNALARQQTPKPVNLKGLDGAAYDSVKAAGEFKLKQRTKEGDGELPGIPVKDLVACFRRLSKAVVRAILNSSRAICVKQGLHAKVSKRSQREALHT